MRRCAETLVRLAENIQLAEDFASEAPKLLAKLIAVTGKKFKQLAGEGCPISRS